MIGVDTWYGPVTGLMDTRASMGPRRDWRGYNIVIHGLTKSLGLQWGHAVIGVDTNDPRIPSRARRTLQWGHAVIGVDTEAPLVARLFDRVLQWGHAVIGVDTWPPGETP